MVEPSVSGCNTTTRKSMITTLWPVVYVIGCYRMIRKLETAKEHIRDSPIITERKRRLKVIMI